jgi:RNA polymerase sigma-70 factor (ECF subfamily)
MSAQGDQRGRAERAEWSALMAAAQSGDARAYRQLLAELAPFLRFVARRRGLDPASCDDVAQDIMLTIHRVRHTYDPDRPFVPWVLSIAYRRIIDLHRRDGRIRGQETSVPELLETFPDPTPNLDLEIAEQREWLRQALVSLPRKQREALELVKLRDMSVAEAAARSGQSPGAIKVNVHRAIKSLRAILGTAT